MHLLSPTSMTRVCSASCRTCGVGGTAGEGRRRGVGGGGWEGVRIHLVDDEGDVAEDMVEGGGRLVDDAEVYLARKVQRRHHRCRQYLYEEPARSPRPHPLTTTPVRPRSAVGFSDAA